MSLLQADPTAVLVEDMLMVSIDISNVVFTPPQHQKSPNYDSIVYPLTSTQVAFPAAVMTRLLREVNQRREIKRSKRAPSEK
jgi:hypothetical protein